MSMKQPEIDFPTESPINTEKLGKQNNDIYNFLKTGKRLNRHLAENLFGVGNLHSRISDLRNNHKIDIKDQFVTAVDRFGNKVKCKEYWIDDTTN